ncbi:MAG TPA: hypothetical protein VFK06_06765 [Candidatus Angelobacter sp.]|nr:hypothetical protein [Candidatus Angelobacter sp.]
MALLDFIKQRTQQQSGPKPTMETPKLEAQKDVSKVLSGAELAKFRDVGERLQKATTYSRSQLLAPAAGDDSNAALLQKQNNQNKAQAALSPTDHHKGQTAIQKRARGWER